MTKRNFLGFRSNIFFTVFITTLLFFIGIGCVKSTQPQGYRQPSRILVDQFGYRPNDQKIAVIVENSESKQPLQSDIQNSQGLQQEKQTIQSPKHHKYRLIDLDNHRNVYEADSVLWNNGQIHEQSGDIASWFDFSSVTQTGHFEIKNVATQEVSAPFVIAENPYKDVLIAATRMFFYQRSGFPKQTPYADSRWLDAAAFLGANQDTEAHFVNDKTNTSLAKDMHGGWFDAGDTNKYVTFADRAIHQMLDAYRQNPGIWTDDFNIPESNNGIPDILDEIQFELDWLQRMQDDDGGVFIKVGTLDHDGAQKPSLDTRPRYYGPKCSSSTIAAASMFAHAGWAFQTQPALAPVAEQLKTDAISAWQWYTSHPQQMDCDTQEIKAGDADLTAEEQNATALSAAVYLYALTRDSQYDDYVNQHYQDNCAFCYEEWAIYKTHLGNDALLAYTELEFANANLKADIKQRFRNLVTHSSSTYGSQQEKDPYLAYMPDDQYHWGSNAVKANYGLTNYDVVLYGVDTGKNQAYESRALNHLHYFHGFNPLGIVFLTNMYDYGSSYSANEMFHEWFGNGIYDNAITSPSGPAPGYLTGGVNRGYTGEAELKGSSIMKSYVDSNEPDLRMWEITEPAIYYQSAYLKLLSRFCS